MADMQQFQDTVSSLITMGFDPEDAVRMLENGIKDPAAMPYIPQRPTEASIADDAEEAKKQIAAINLQNSDQVRNGGSSNRTHSGPLPWYVGETAPGGVNTTSIPDDLYFSPRPQEFDPTQYNGPGPMPPSLPGDPRIPEGAEMVIQPGIDIVKGAIGDAINPVWSAIDGARGLMGFPGFSAGEGITPGMDMDAAPVWVEDPQGGPLPVPLPEVDHTAEGGTSGNPSNTSNAELATTESTTETKENKLNAVQRFAQDKFGWDEDKRSDIGRALLMGGLATMAGDSPDAFENIGKGGLVGANAYFNAGDERRQQGLEEEQLAMDREKHEASMSKIQQDLKAGKISIEQAEAALANPDFYAGIPEDVAQVEKAIDYYMQQGYSREDARDMAYRIYKMRDVSPAEEAF